MEEIDYPKDAMRPTYHAQSDEKLPPNTVKSEVLDAIISTWRELKYASPDSIKESIDWSKSASKKVRSSYDLLPPGYESTTVLEHPQGTRVTTCTAEDPAILFEHRASFCTLLLSFDATGNAAILHQPMYGEIGDKVDDEDLDSKLEEFRRVSQSTVNSQGLTLVSATNALNKDTGQQKRVLQGVVNKMAPDKIEPLFIRAEESAYKDVGRLEELRRHLKDSINKKFTKNSPLPGDIRDISGLIFVPSEVSVSGKNIIFVIDKNTDMVTLQETLFPKIAQPSTA